MAEQDDARVQEIRARLEAATPGPWQAWTDGTEESVESVSVGRFVCHLNSNLRQFREDATFIANAREDVPYLLASLDALTAERDAQRAIMDAQSRVSEQHHKRVQELAGDLEHALASVGALRAALEDVWSKAVGESGEDGFIVSYVIPNGTLHRAIGLARGTDAGGKLLAERDALATRLAAAEAANARAADSIMQDVLDLDPDDPEHPDTICISYDALVVVLENALRGADAALAGSREQAAGKGEGRDGSE